MYRSFDATMRRAEAKEKRIILIESFRFSDSNGHLAMIQP
jgi:hypothetical protein